MSSKLLLVYPDNELRQQLVTALARAGFEQIHEASNGSDAVSLLQSGQVDALITDIPIDDLDGWRLTRLVRSDVYPVDAAMPVIVLTRSFSERIAEVTAKEYEIDAFIPYERRHELPETLQSMFAQAQQGHNKPSLLVIEDNPDTVRVVERVLKPRFNIESAMTGTDGLAAWQQRRHDLVLLDVMLPGMNGEDVLKEILALRPAQSVVMMTADSSEERAGRLVLAGAADFIAKPFRAEQLRRVCDIAIRREDYMHSNAQFAHQVEALNREKERALVTLDSIGDGVITTDTSGTIESINPVAERMTGWSSSEAIGLKLDAVFQVVNEFTHTQTEDPVVRCLEEGKAVELGSHNLLIHRTGSEVAIQDTVAPIKARSGEMIGVVLVFHDVTEARKLNKRLSYQATHDSLTGLINRSEFERRLSRLLEDSRDNGSEHVLCYLDLDQFKVMNDTCGHMAGDQLLRQVATLIQQVVRRHDTLARLGGDEFGILLEYCSIEKATEVADSVRQSLVDYRFTYDDKLFALGVSVGVVPLSPENHNLEDALSMADAACYLAKEAGRNRIHVYHPDDGEINKRYGEMQWVSRVMRAFEEQRFILFYQTILPINGAEDGDHYEVLIRMHDEQGKLVPPGFFLPAVERYDLAATMDRWVIRTTLQWFEDNPEQLEQLAHCAINLSGKSLGDDHFHEFVTEILTHTCVPPNKICFEITETAAITNLDKAIRFITTFKAMGCRFALDDFGSGMSSFAYLKTLPVDYLKIDGQFVKDMLDDPIDRIMVKSINEVGHDMGLKTIAEFVENRELLELLRRMGVDYAQGYGIDVPQPLEERKVTGVIAESLTLQELSQSAP
ncbi:hypothetical protein BOW53_12570 [Solemya pervernicosa gill symbiont]|uniref:Two-component system response regulator n=1 Tax=Solemya pervernicosa gill symbiont TaxID=642797 RepID=A0A1T2L2F4_9GAMM|nr:GGDEF domain-containing response regulator [Solemya pervernicosa gill symbiont]OOZ39210.1 hypothetical protein BOW53_12570 [Solemya pervernicosa gill symbiont]